jgi:hypothetical protein
MALTLDDTLDKWQNGASPSVKKAHQKVMGKSKKKKFKAQKKRPTCESSKTAIVI